MTNRLPWRSPRYGLSTPGNLCPFCGGKVSASVTDRGCVAVAGSDGQIWGYAHWHCVEDPPPPPDTTADIYH